MTVSGSCHPHTNLLNLSTTFNKMTISEFGWKCLENDGRGGEGGEWLLSDHSQNLKIGLEL